MKKLVTSIMATAMILGVSSCGDHDFEAPISEKQQRYDSYDKAFTEAFGYVHPDQDWGFGEKTSTPKTTRAAASTISFSRDYSGCYAFRNEGVTIYKNALPEAKANMHEVSEYRTGGWDIDKGCVIINYPYFYVDTTTHSINCWAGVCDIYFEAGNYSISKISTNGKNTRIFLLPGAHVKITSISEGGLAENYPGNIVSIAENASLEFVDCNLKSTYNFYVKGKLKAPTITLYADGFIYNSGTIECDLLHLSTTKTEVVNAGQLTCHNQLHIAGEGGKFQNIGNVTVEGCTLIDATNGTWRNDNGTFTTEEFNYSAGSHDIINGCKLIVNKLFKFLPGNGATMTFENATGAYVYAKRFEFSNAKILMGAKSMIEVEEKAVMACSTNPDMGIYGIGNDYAVFKADSIVKGCQHAWEVDDYRVKKIIESTTLSQQNLISYRGKLIVDANYHFEDGVSGGNYVNTESTVGWNVKSGLTEEGTILPTGFSISGNCSGTYGTSDSDPDPEDPEDPEDQDDPVEVDRVFAEDLGAIGDWDFNDVVFDVVYHTKAPQYTEVIIQAAGGTMPLYLSVPDMVKDDHGNDKSVEVHEAFGVPVTTMVNTGGQEVEELPKILRYDGRYYSANVTITVQYGDGPNDLITINAERGEPAGKFVVPAGTKWQKERVDIRNNEDIKFIKWVREAGTLIVSGD